MFSRKITSLFAAAALAVGCAQTSVQGEDAIRYGTVTRIDAVEINSPNELGWGAVIGAVAGGVLGHQVGGGHGRDVATVAGALAGGYAGSMAQSNIQKQRGDHVFVQLRNGVSVGITQPPSNLRVGDHVVIQGRGSEARALRD